MGAIFCELKPSLVSLADTKSEVNTELRNCCTAQISQIFNTRHWSLFSTKGLKSLVVIDKVVIYAVMKVRHRV